MSRPKSWGNYQVAVTADWLLHEAGRAWQPTTPGLWTQTWLLSPWKEYRAPKGAEVFYGVDLAWGSVDNWNWCCQVFSYVGIREHDVHVQMQVSSFRFIGEGGERKRHNVNESTSQSRDEVGGYRQETPRFRVLRPFVSRYTSVFVHAHAHFPTQGFYMSVEDYILKLCIRGWGCVGALGARRSHPELCQGENLRCVS